LLARRSLDVTSGKFETVRESREQRLRRQKSDARCRQLDRQRQPVHRTTDTRDVSRIASVERESRSNHLCLLNEQTYGAARGHRVEISPLRKLEWLHCVLVLA
jgi:hypothetical protein